MAKQLDPKKKFVVSVLTRESLAAELNEVLSDQASAPVREFSPGDPRLTDEVCRRTAELIGDIAAETADEESELEHEIYAALLVRFGFGFEF